MYQVKINDPRLFSFVVDLMQEASKLTATVAATGCIENRDLPRFRARLPLKDQPSKVIENPFFVEARAHICPVECPEGLRFTDELGLEARHSGTAQWAQNDVVVVFLENAHDFKQLVPVLDTPARNYTMSPRLLPEKS